MNRFLPRLCGGLDAAFVAFHLLLFPRIQHLPVPAEVRALMHAFNVGGLLMIGSLAFAFLRCRNDLGTRLGRGAIVLGALVYLTRTAGELTFFPTPNPVIAVACLLVGVLHLGLLRRNTKNSCASA